MRRPQLGGESRRLGTGKDMVCSRLLLVPVVEEAANEGRRWMTEARAVLS